ncbi:MAG: tryptophan synthase subunit alpha [Candidatus Omnitrophica bacterium]|nr:tryptophan synthase subunit alpha [Candidatus Omnitrophota bacterium]
MNRIVQKFRELKKADKKALITYVMAGDPDLRMTYKLILEMARQGADIIELGVPFSDPIADGPTIQRAGQRALRSKTDLGKILTLVSRLRKKTEVPIILMTYFNILFRFSLVKFVREASKRGVDGLIIPDLIPEEAGELLSLSKTHNLSLIFLVSSTSGTARIKKIASMTRGFIYYVSLTGVTGARSSLPQDIKDNVLRIKRISSKPVCVGFGISGANQVKEIFKFSDGAVVGSAIINVIEKNLGKRNLVEKVGSFIKHLKS